MKRMIKIAGLSLGVVAALGFTSCTNELNNLSGNNGSNGLSLAKAPDITAWSGSHYLTPANGTTDTRTFTGAIETRTNAGDGDLNNKTWEEYGADNLTNITDEERAKVLQAIKDKVTGERISEDVVFPWKAYFLQDVISGQNGSWTDAGSNGTSSSSYTFEAFNKGKNCNSPSWKHCDDNTAANYEEVTNSAHLNNYYLKRDGNQTRINETTLMTDMEYGTYEEMKGKQFRWYINCHENLHWYEYIVVEVDGSYYICFDFGCGHPENDVDGNPGKGAEPNDWDYNDWILKISPAGPQPDVWTGKDPGDDNCEICDHPSHEPGKCPVENCPEEDCHPTPEQPKEPGDTPDSDPCPNGKCDHDATHHPDGEGGGCNECGDDEGCNEKKQEVPEVKFPDDLDPEFGVMDCPICRHLVYYVIDTLTGKKTYYHKFDDTEMGVDCAQCWDENHPDNHAHDCTNEILQRAIDGTTETPTTPSNPGSVYKHKNEVEVNLEIVDSHKNLGLADGLEDLATKLSIHVRHATDVEVIIPIPTRYVIDSDDLYIFETHYGDLAYGGYIKEPNQTVLYNLADTYEIKLHVEFVGPQEDVPNDSPLKDGYIKIWTEGINENVINWCMEHNGDGINFEIWTYFEINKELTRVGLKRILDQSTIEFKNSNPDYYINAFGYDYVDGTNGAQHKEDVNPDDCTVKPVDSTTFGEQPHHTGTHLNGTPHNDIYVKNGLTPDHAHGSEQ